MKRVMMILAAGVALALVASPALVAGSQAGQALTTEKTYEGQLSKVDLASKTIEVKGADSKMMSFSFNEQTQMLGIDKAPQGLTGKTGSDLKVTYRENRGSNLAVKIEVSEKPAAPNPAPR